MTDTADYATLQRAYRARGFSGESHDMVVMRHREFWRLLDGPELPFQWLDLSTPTYGMRYAPYKPYEIPAGALC